MHGLQAESDLVETELTKFLWEVAISMNNNIGEVATLHELNENPEAILMVVDFLALDQLLAVKEGDQTTFVDDVLTLGLRSRICKLQSEQLFIWMTLNLEYCSVSTFTNLTNDLIYEGRVLIFYFNGFVQ